MTPLGIIALSFLGFAAVGIVLLGFSHEGDWDSPYRPRLDRYWMSMVYPILIVGGLAGAMLVGILGAAAGR